MVYLEKQFKGDKYYYYLTKSLREQNKKVKKIRYFVGVYESPIDKAEEQLLVIDNLSSFQELVDSHTSLTELTDYKHSIFFDDEWELFSQEDIDELKKIQKEYSKLQSQKNKPYYDHIREEFIIRHAYDTNKVEGSTFSFEETKALLTRGMILEAHTQREVFEISNIRDSYDFIENYKGEFNSKFIRDLHKEITKNTLKYPLLEGMYRKKGVNVRMENNPYRTVPGEHVSRVMREAIKCFEKYYLKEPFGAIIRFYVAFLAIHPFLDGNGRTSRLVLSYLFMSEGLPPINFDENDHLNHIKYLNMAMNGEGFTPIAQFIMNRLKLNIWTNR